MKFNRRDLLKFFGAGTVIAPVAAAEPLARLIELPKLEIVEATKIPEPININKVKSVAMVMTMDDGTVRTIHMGNHWISRALLAGNSPGVLYPTDHIKADIWFDVTSNSSPNAAFHRAFLSGDVTL